MSLSQLFRSRLARGEDSTERPNFIFGYGSLIERASRVATSPHAQVAFPVAVKGVQRGWFDQMSHSRGLTPTYLGAVEKAGETTNGVVYSVSKAELQQFEDRETGYAVKALRREDITFYDGRSEPPDANFYFFATTDPHPPDEDHPIVQSYVDIVMTGALEQEANYPLAQEAGYTEALVSSTTSWSEHWINDRLHPYRPFIAVPDAYDIDAILSAHFRYYPARPS